MSVCFVCLNKCKNKICCTCKCYAHPKCWGEYLQHSTDVYTYVYPSQVVLQTPISTPCPQCRQNINNVKPITRADTFFARGISLINNYNNLLYAADLAETIEEKLDMFDVIFSGFVSNKNLIKNDNFYLNVLCKKLKELYTLYNWKKANLYHFELFNTQLVT
jgi:hypothetical protein